MTQPSEKPSTDEERQVQPPHTVHTTLSIMETKQLEVAKDVCEVAERVPFQAGAKTMPCPEP